MAYPTKRITEARSAYVYDALNLEGVSRKTNIPLGTIRRWKDAAKENGDDWDKARAAARLSAQGAEAVTAAVMEDFVLLFQSTLEDVKNSKDIKPLDKAEVLSRISDAYSKTMNAVAKGNPKMNKLSVAMEVLQLLAKHIQNDRPDLIEPFAALLGSFGEKLTEMFG